MPVEVAQLVDSFPSLVSILKLTLQWTWTKASQLWIWVNCCQTVVRFSSWNDFYIWRQALTTKAQSMHILYHSKRKRLVIKQIRINCNLTQKMLAQLDIVQTILLLKQFLVVKQQVESKKALVITNFQSESTQAKEI